MSKEVTEDDVKELDRLSMWSSPKRGRPVKWTEEAIDKFADELLVFAELKTSLVLASFATDRRMNPDILSYLAGLSVSFFEALKTAKRIIGSRREEGTLLKNYEPKTYSMSQRMYDPEWSKHMDAQLAREELIKAEAKIKALKKELKHQGEILDYIQGQKKIDEVME